MSKEPARGGSGRKHALDADAVNRVCDATQALFGENFRLARIRARLTQSDIEIHTGIKQAYISQIEGGKLNATLATMTILALAVGKDVRALLKPLPASGKR